MWTSAPTSHMVIGVPDAKPAQRLAEVLLGQPLDQWVAERRAVGMSWRTISADLAVSTQHQLKINRETLRNWYREPDEALS